MITEKTNIEQVRTKKVLITGAAGFIGSHVAEYFCDKEVSVSCFVKESSDLRYIKNLPIGIVYGDISNPQELDRALANIDAVVHIAALSKDWGSYDAFFENNVQGTLNILKGCTKQNIKNIIITGSISSYGEENSKDIKNEEYPYNSDYKYFLNRVFPCKMNYYRNSKADCTQRAVEFAMQNTLNVTILEPSWVYGEREFNTGFYEYLKTSKSRIPFFPGSKKNNFHVVYVKDLARAYYLAFLQNLSGVNRIIIGNSQIEKMDVIFSFFCKELGVPKPKNIPKFIIYPIGFILELVYTLLSTKQPPMLTRGRVNMFYDNIEYSTQKAQKLLSFNNEYSLEQGIRRTVAWYKEHNLI